MALVAVADIARLSDFALKELGCDVTLPTGGQVHGKDGPGMSDKLVMRGLMTDMSF